jgi:hypothetical protein
VPCLPPSRNQRDVTCKKAEDLNSFAPTRRVLPYEMSTTPPKASLLNEKTCARVCWSGQECAGVCWNGHEDFQFSLSKGRVAHLLN